MNTELTNSGIKALKIGGYRIELSVNVKGQLVARSYRLLTAGKNKGQYKLIEGYYFQNEEKRIAWVTKKAADFKSHVDDINERVTAKKEIRQNMQHGFEVGQVYYTSWGYDQTNVDFYLVLEVKGKRVLVQHIGADMAQSEGLSSMAANVTPNPENKIGEPVWRNIQFYLGQNNTPNYYIKEPKFCNYNMYLYTKADKGVYCSWYA